MPPTQQDIDDADTLREARSNVIRLIRTITERPRPTYNVDGQIFQWGEYHRLLWEQLKELDKALGRRLGARVLWLGKRCYPVTRCICPEEENLA